MTPKIKKFLFGLPLLVLAGSGCDSSLEEVACGNHLPTLIQDIDHATLALEPWKPIIHPAIMTEGRKLASADAKPLPPVIERPLLLEADRQAWSSWATTRLHRAQRFGDLVRTDQTPRGREVREEASQIATEMVVFLGYVQKGNVEKMNETLQRMRLLSDQTFQKICKK